MIAKIYNHNDPKSIAAWTRRRRITFFLSLLKPLPQPFKILDVGGRADFWQNSDLLQAVGHKSKILLLNVNHIELNQTGGKINPNIECIIGDARDLAEFHDTEFDIVFSNSVIEHVGNYEQQKLMAQEVRRVGQRYFIQTPNFYFPIEPHFVFPGFHWLPLKSRALLASNFSLGWYEKFDSFDSALAEVSSIGLLTRAKLESLFPSASFFEEKFLGLTKSLIAYEGW